MDQYLDTRDVVSDFSDFKTVSDDIYSDAEMYKTIAKRKAMKPLLYCAIQTAIVGYGNNTFGEYEMNGERINVAVVYKEFDVKDDDDQNIKLEIGDLTSRRLQKFYRFQIQDYLEQNKTIYPYLWKKYSTRDEKYRAITFPGAESMVETKEDAEYLLNTYKCLDKTLNTNINERIKRVLVARKLIDDE